MKYRRILTVAALLAAALAAVAGRSQAGWLDLIKGLAGSGDEDSHTSTSVAAVRGLDDDQEKAAANSGVRNFAAIDRLDRLRISDAELDRFIAEGRLAR